MNTNSNAVEGDDPYTAEIRKKFAELRKTTTEDGDICDGCDNAYKSVFRVPDEVWSQIAPKPDSLGEHIEHQYGGLLCLNCADNAARKSGITLVWDARLNWGDTTEDGAGRVFSRAVGSVCETLCKQIAEIPETGASENELRLGNVLANIVTPLTEARQHFEETKTITALSPSPSNPLTPDEEYALVEQINSNPNLRPSPSGGVVDLGAMAVAKEIEGDGFDPFQNPEAFDHYQKIAGAVIKTTTPQHTTSPDALLREALKPFVELASCYDDEEDDSHEVWLDAGPCQAIQEAASAFKLGNIRKLARIDQHLQGAKP